jgi:K+-sensing histidine kinase KdpD
MGVGVQLAYPRELRRMRARTSRASVPQARSVLHSFVERTRKTINHDLRAPLAAIVNYAAVLEEDEAPEAGRVRPTMQRIRHHARQVADMVAAAMQATALAARDGQAARTPEDPFELVRSIVVESGFDEMVHPVDGRDASGSGVPGAVAIDRDLFRFAIHAFLELESCARPQVRRPLRIRAATSAGATTVVLAFEEKAVEGAPLELDVFLHGYGDEAPRAPRFELALASELFACEGGTIAVRGRPGRGATLELRLPPG